MRKTSVGLGSRPFFHRVPVTESPNRIMQLHEKTSIILLTIHTQDDQRINGNWPTQHATYHLRSSTFSPSVSISLHVCAADSWTWTGCNIRLKVHTHGTRCIPAESVLLQYHNHVFRVFRIHSKKKEKEKKSNINHGYALRLTVAAMSGFLWRPRLGRPVQGRLIRWFAMACAAFRPWPWKLMHRKCYYKSSVLSLGSCEGKLNQLVLVKSLVRW